MLLSSLQGGKIRDCYEEVEEDESVERSITSKTEKKVEKVKKMFMDCCRITVKEVAGGGGILLVQFKYFFRILDLKHVTAKLIRELLNLKRNCAKLKFLRSC